MSPKAFLRSIDAWLIIALLGLLGLGLFALSDATQTLVPHHPYYFVKHQIEYFVAGVVVMVAVMAVPFETWRRLRWPIYAVMVVLLMAVLVKGHTALGAQRWIGFGSVQVQPSEFAKVGLILVLADILEQMKGGGKRFRDVMVPLLVTLVPVALVIKQPDLGTALVLIGILVVLLYEAGMPGLRVLSIFGGTGAFVVVLILAHLKLGMPLPLIKDYQLNRLIVFVNPYADPMGAGYNVIQSQIALGTGSLGGVPASTIQPILTFLPARYTDFIYASLALELGLAGTLGALILYVIMVARGFHIAAATRDPYASLVAIGATALLGIHVLMNVGMVTGIMPVVGVPLPFISYGGSSVVTDFAAIGLLLSAKMRQVKLSFA